MSRTGVDQVHVPSLMELLKLQFAQSDDFPSMTTRCERFFRKFSIHICNGPLIP